MATVKITDLVDQQAIDKIKELNTEMRALLDTYTNTARALASGVNININVVGDLDRLEKLLTEKSKEAAEATEKLNKVMAEQQQVIANTTNTISRELMEQERVNKANREAYTDTEKFKNLLDQVNGSYEERVKRLVETNEAIAKNKKQQDDLKKSLQDGKTSQEDYNRAMVRLTMQERELKQIKADLNTQMKNEEREMQSVEGSYKNLSQRLELLKKAYKDLTEDERNSDIGKEMEAAIQNLDAHLKDVAADMGEFQRNVGNYAIAGKNGVVTTQSIIAAIEQEARTTQDLIDQNRVLEEGKARLDVNDANYATTLAAVNAKLEENRQKLTDVSSIMGKQPQTVHEAEEQNKKLTEALKHVDVNSEGAQQRISELNKKIEENNQIIERNTPSLNKEKKALQDVAKSAQKAAMAERERIAANKGAANELLSLVGINNNFGSSLQNLSKTKASGVVQGLGLNIKALGKTLTGLLSNPWVLAFLGIAGVGAGFKWWYDYNKGLIESTKLTKNFSKLVGGDMQNVRSEIQALADQMGEGFDKTIGAANLLVNQFGVSWNEASNIMNVGFAAGANMSGEMLANIEKYSGAFKDAGISAEEFVAVLVNTKDGLFDEKALKGITDAGLRIKNMSAKTSQALEDIGISSKKMQTDLESGNITMLEAIQQVSDKLQELPPNAQETGAALVDVFGRKSAKAGQEVLASISDINTSLKDIQDNMSEVQKLTLEEIEVNKELNNTLAAVFDMGEQGFVEMTKQAKIYLVRGVIEIIKGTVDLINYFIRLYNRSVAIRFIFNAFGASFKNIWAAAKILIKNLVDGFKSLGTVVEGVFTMDWDKVKQGFKEGAAAYSRNFAGFVNEVKHNTKTVLANSEKDFVQEISYTPKLTGAGGIAPDKNNKRRKPTGTGNGPEDKAAADKAKKQAEKEAADVEKRAKEELKRLNELEESKIEMMEDYHLKEIAQIRLKFKKKIDEIRGNGATEVALRLQLAKQCDKEVSEAEEKYQKELAKINLENRLALVKEGSEQEKNLKVAQIEANREVELEAAEKTGADVNLINAKFDQLKKDLEAEYAAKRAEEIMNQYAHEEAMREAAMTDEIATLRANYAEKLKLAKGDASKIEELQTELQNAEAEIAEKYGQQTVRATVKMLEEILKNEELSAEDRMKYEEQLAKAKADLEQQIADGTIANIERVNDADSKSKEKRMQNVQMWLDVAADAMGNISELISTVYDNKIQKIEEEQEANTAANEDEQERITQLVSKKIITEEEGEARKRAAEAKTAKKNEELEKRKAQLKVKQAKWDKANSIAQATISTALAVMNALQTKPFWVGIAMAAIAGAMGAVQIATIAATPIPAYAKGTDRHAGGPAIVGDGGRPEVIVFNGGAWMTPDTPTLVDIPAGASVMPSLEAFGNSSEIIALPQSAVMSSAKSYDDRNVRKGISEMIYVMKNQTRQQHVDSYLLKYEMFKSKL